MTTETEKATLLRRYMASASGRSKIAASLREPLRIAFDYVAPWRSRFRARSPQKQVEKRLHGMYQDLIAAGEAASQNPLEVELNVHEIHDLVVLPEGCERIPFDHVWTRAFVTRAYPETIGQWLRVLVERGSTYEVADDVARRMIGMRDVEADTYYLLPVTKVSDRKAWDIEVPDPIVKLLLKPEGREKLARMLTTGCLRFG